MAVTIFVTLAIRKADVDVRVATVVRVGRRSRRPSFGQARGLDPEEAPVNIGEKPAGGGLADEVIERGEVHAVGTANRCRRDGVSRGSCLWAVGWFSRVGTALDG